jgi:hypothetical protein
MSEKAKYTTTTCLNNVLRSQNIDRGDAILSICCPPDPAATHGAADGQEQMANRLINVCCLAVGGSDWMVAAAKV